MRSVENKKTLTQTPEAINHSLLATRSINVNRFIQTKGKTDTNTYVLILICPDDNALEKFQALISFVLPIILTIRNLNN